MDEYIEKHLVDKNLIIFNKKSRRPKGLRLLYFSKLLISY